MTTDPGSLPQRRPGGQLDKAADTAAPQTDPEFVERSEELLDRVLDGLRHSDPDARP